MDAVASLADTEYQQRVWRDRIYPNQNFYHDFTAVIHTLYDDMEVLPNPGGSIGTVLVDGPEVARLRRLGEFLDQILERHRLSTDRQILNDPLWPKVVEAAKIALAAMVLDDPWPDDASSPGSRA